MIDLHRERCGQQDGAALCRSAGYLGEGEQALFLLCDRPAEDGDGFHWILCPSVGIDYMNAWRGLRHLAESLATRGQTLWRIDYPQTGASADPPQQDQPALWVDSIRRLIDQLRSRPDVSGIGLIGFRFGATLAALAAQERPVEALVCWSPIVRGAQLIRQTLLLQNSAETEQQDGLLEAAGWVLNEPTRKSVQAIDLGRLLPNAARVLIVDGEDAKRSRRLHQAWSEQGAGAVDYLPLDETPDMLVDAHRTRVPRQTIAAIGDWVQGVQPGQAAGTGPVDALPASARLVVQPEGLAEASTVREQAGFTASGLFAIHCRPPAETDETAPLVLLLNSGSNHQVGPNRLYVSISRLLAGCGIESLRVDLPGLGETPARDGVEENLPYPPEPVVALQGLIDDLELGQRPLILMGLCSGAYHAFVGAIELRADIREILLINPLTFYWEQGMQLADAPSVSYGEWNWYQQSLRDPDRWKRLLSGRINPWPIARSVMRRLGLKLQTRLRRLGEAFERGPADRITPSLGNSLRKIEQRGMHLVMVFADSDPGLAILREQAGRRFAAMRRRGSAEWLLIERADHTLSRRRPRQQLLDWLQRHFAA